LEGKAVRGGAVKVAAQAVQAVVGVGSAMVLARLLTPADFGLMAMVVSLTALTSAVNDFGLPMATVHREDVTHGEVSTLFWVNASLSLLIGLLLCAMAPVLAWFYGEPALTAMTFVMAVGVVGLGLSSQHEALLTRQMRFGALTLVDVGSLVAGVAVGIGAAALGLAYWALVLQFVTMNLTRMAAVWAIAGWRPGRPGGRAALRGGGVRAMLSYGFGYSGSTVLNHVSRNIDRVLVGYVHGPAAVGLYDNAYRWSLFPLHQLYKPLKTVAVSGLSRVQNEPETFRAYFRNAQHLVLSVTMPLIAFVFAETRDVVLVLLGDQWLGAVPILQVLSVNAFLRTIGKITPWLYLAQGQTGRQLRWSALYAPLLILAVVVGVQWGAFGVAVGFTVATALLTYPELAYCLRTSHLTGRDLARVLWRPTAASVSAALVAFAFDPARFVETALFFDVLAEAAVFGLTYALVWVGLPGGRRALNDVLRLASRLRKQQEPPPDSTK
jgi:PST family polysaccharide transporter